MSRLRDRMIEDLRLRGRADNTIDTYVRCVRKLVEWAGVAPGKINAAMVRAFLLYLMDERGLAVQGNTTEPSTETNDDWQSLLLDLTGLDVRRCPQCHQMTMTRAPLPDTRAPPIAEAAGTASDPDSVRCARTSRFSAQ